jgi:Epoxide hydrolase N terminus
MSVPTEHQAAATAIRPFQVSIPEEDLIELRRRVQATRWPSKELVADASQGVQLATLQALARYWASEYDWRRCEAKLNALPQFTTEIDGVDIHFLHVRSPQADALPLIITHGWPGSVIEMLETSVRSPTRPRTAATPRTPSTWWCRRCPATASRASRSGSAGTAAASRAPGPS